MITKKECMCCKIKYRKLYLFKGNFICYRCKRVIEKDHIIWGSINNKFNEPLIYHYPISVCLTDKQKMNLDKRINSVNISKVEYVRRLILRDLFSSETPSIKLDRNI